MKAEEKKESPIRKGELERLSCVWAHLCNPDMIFYTGDCSFVGGSNLE
jgi:hypothetical protein